MGCSDTFFFNLNNPNNKTACPLLNRSKASNPKFERAFCDMFLITDQMKINWLLFSFGFLRCWLPHLS